MKVYSQQVRCTNLGKKIDNINCNLTFDELNLICFALEKIGPQKNNDVLESVRLGIVESIKSL